MNSKVSVVVPIYKVEKYLNRCLDSIIQQTYRNLEVILVDDGSPDQSGSIAEEYAAIDSRIKVIHQENGGLSAARNTGMQYVSGDYTLFVDSDDWLDLNAVTMLVTTCQRYHAEIVQSSFYYAYDEYLLLDKRYCQNDDPPKILNNHQLMTELVINERVKNFAWGKLYKTEIIRDIPFQNGVLFEDVFWAHQVMHRVSKYVIIHQPLCYYFQREDSIIATYTLRNLDIINGLKERQLFIEKFHPELINENNRVLLKNILIHYNLLLFNRKKDYKGSHKKELEKYIKNNADTFRKSVENDKFLANQLFLFLIHPYLNVIFLALRKFLRIVKLNKVPKGLVKTQILKQ